MRRPPSLLVLLLCLLALRAPAAAQTPPPDAPPPDAPAPAETAQAAPAAGPIPAVTTEHVLALDGSELRYRAIAGTLPVQGEDGKPAAHVFTVSYLSPGLSPDTDPARRPVTFVFNGGPGAASAYLHLGALGPSVLETVPDGTLRPPPPRLVDNPATWLAFTDLVFIDPVGTGLSRPVAAGRDAYRPFFSVGGDVDSLGEVVRLWLSRNDRWLSPKFLAGESYGGLRAVMMARDLLRGHGIAMNGLVLISPALDFSTIDGGPSSLLPWALRLPSMVLSAQAHGRAPADLDIAGIERWALGAYLSGLAAIEPPGPGPAQEVIAELERLTGLDRELIARHRGRIPISVFAERLLADQGRILSLYDGTFTGPDPDPASEQAPDPLLDSSIAPLSSAFNAYLGEALGLEAEQPFQLLARRPAREWDWQGLRGERSGGAMDDLAETLALTPGLGVLAVHGRTDLVTPYLASKWLFDHLPLPESERERIQVAVLEGGHMMYFAPALRAELTRLARAFYDRQAGGNRR
jgi:carboxypeptidase C (cathepsin A)